MINFISEAAQDCLVSEEWVIRAIKTGRSRVKLIKIPKKNSEKKRIISRPSSELETLQRWLNIKYFNKIEVHASAMAFVPRRSILNNASKHRFSDYFVRIDFSNFFPSITSNDFFHALDAIPNTGFTCDEETKFFIRHVCFDHQDRLPIGYASSPVISNITMKTFDQTLEKIIAENVASMGNGIYTRYADDIVYSTDLKGGCNEFAKHLEFLLQTIDSPKLRINTKKTIYSSKAGGSAMVTGLRVCQDNHITITRQYKDHIRLLLSLHARQRLPDDEFAALRGHLSYVRTVAPAFFSKMCAKFALTIGKILN